MGGLTFPVAQSAASSRGTRYARAAGRPFSQSDAGRVTGARRPVPQGHERGRYSDRAFGTLDPGHALRGRGPGTAGWFFEDVVPAVVLDRDLGLLGGRARIKRSAGPVGIRGRVEAVVALAVDEAEICRCRQVV